MISPTDLGELSRRRRVRRSSGDEYGCRFAIGAAANRESPEEGFGGSTESMGRL
jgi:hypothetical protein